MFSLTSSFTYYLYALPTDMRKSFDGLCGLIKSEMHLDPRCGAVFIFISRKRDRIKLLHWERGGLVLYYKRLEEGTFALPRFDPSTNRCKMTLSDLVLMVEGIMVEKYKQRKRYKDKKKG